MTTPQERDGVSGLTREELATVKVALILYRVNLMETEGGAKWTVEHRDALHAAAGRALGKVQRTIEEGGLT